MQRPSVYPYEITDPPGVNVHRLRNMIGWTMRRLAERCHPSLDHTTIRRLERNEGFTQDTMERVAKALGIRKWQDLFLPPELSEWSHLPKRARARIAALVKDAAAARRYRLQKTESVITR